MRISRIIILAIALAPLITSTAMGQVIGHENPPPHKPAVKVKPKVTKTTGSLSVAAEPNASILVEMIKTGDEKHEVVPADEKVLVFNGLKPGRYRVTGTLAEHETAKAEVTVAANLSQSITLNLPAILYTVTINTNINNGQLKYGPADQPRNRLGTIQNKTVQLKLPAGTYVAEIEAEDAGYQSRVETFKLAKAETYQFDLSSVESTETLSAKWTKSEIQSWEVPSNWDTDSKHLRIKGAGVALPHDLKFRNYKNFRLESFVKVTNGIGISFALRATDTQNYYLLQLTGEKSDEPYVVRLFAVKNGVPRRLRAITLPKSSFVAMSSGNFFNIYITMIGYDITVEIDGEGGIANPLGKLTDASHSFPIGAVGIAAREGENAVVDRFVVCTGKCLQ